jgi:NAD dependent epimerase/dehydratase family
MAMVTVTGGTGVLGREVVPRLQADGHEVAVLNRRPAAPLPDGVRRLVGDLAAGRGPRDDGAGCRCHRSPGLSAVPAGQSRRGRDDGPGRRDPARRRPAARGPCLHRRRGPHTVAVLQAEKAGGGAGDRLGASVHDPARHPVPRSGADGVGLRRVRAGDGRARRDLLPARGRRRCRGSPGPDRMVRAGGWLRRRPGRPAGP